MNYVFLKLTNVENFQLTNHYNLNNLIAFLLHLSQNKFITYFFFNFNKTSTY